MEHEIRASCAPGAVCDEVYVPVAPGVSLHVCSFQPPHKSTLPTLVFVPGWISLVSAWSKLLRALTQEFKVLYIETREKVSARTRWDTGYGVREIAHDIAHVVERMKDAQEQYVLAGSSLGATAVIESCRVMKRKPEGIVLIAPNAEFRIPPLGLFIIKITNPCLYMLIKPVIKWYLRVFRLDTRTDYAQYRKYCRSLDAADPWKLKKAAIAFSDYQIWGALQFISMPVLVVGASKDVLHEPDNLKKMRLRMGRVMWVDLETNQRTHSAEIVTYLKRFLEKCSQGAEK